MSDQTLYLVGGHLVCKLTYHTDALLSHQFLQISLQEDSVIITDVGISRSRPPPWPLCLEPNLRPPRVIICGMWRVTVQHLLQGRDGLQGTAGVPGGTRGKCGAGGMCDVSVM